MLITGQFKDIDNSIITVNIVTENSTSTTRTIGENGLFFSGDPIHIETSIKDMFEHVIRKSATINLVTNSYVGSLFFANNSRSTTVEIKKGNTVLFKGYVDPNTYSQPWTNPLDEFEINCIDCLSTLQYYNYKETTIDNYKTNKQTASNVTFKSIIDNIFTDILGSGRIYYDKSKGITSGTTQNVFTQLGISENVMYGEDFTKIWTQQATLEEMLRYLNLHIIQEGKDYYIFDWNTLKNGRTSWVNLATNTSTTKSVTRVNLNSTMHSDNSTSITIDEVYNQVQVKDDLNGQDTVIQSPLDKDALTSLYTGKQLYMTEYISEGNGDNAHDALVAMVNGNATTYDNAKEIDWYIQAMNNTNWKFYYDGQNVVDTLAESDGTRYINQWKLARYLKQNQCVPCIFKMGSVEHNASATDNSIVSKISMTPYLYISINGNENDTENSQSPTDATIQSHSPMIEYIANNSGGVFSPTDDETTNYLVFSGKMLLQPIVYESSSDGATRTNNYQDIKTNGLRKDEGSSPTAPSYNGTSVWGHNNNIKSDNNDDGRYYTRKFYSQIYPSDAPSSYLTDGTCGVQPWTKDKSAHGYEFNYSKSGDSTDQLSKLPVLACELIIGNKRLIERHQQGFGERKFEWVTIGQEPTEIYNSTSYPVTTFTLGVNPKIGDYIIGDEFDIQNTVSYTMNIDAEGTAIPIKKSDQLSGAVIFRILGPVNSLWNDITRIHPSFWRHTQWTNSWHFILSHVENIIIKDFECKVYSNNGLFEVNKEKDLIYMSDETDDYIHKKDGITFKFITQLSGSEAYEKGLSSGVNLNAVIDMTNNLPLTSIYNATTNETAKAEEHYVDAYYREYCQPKILLETQLHKASNINLFNTYRSTTLSKNFFIQSMGLDVKMNNTNITLKEI